MKLRQKKIGLRVVVTALLLLACLCFGGSASMPLYEMGLAIFGFGCLLVVLWSGNTPKIEEAIRAFIIAFASLVSIQLMPLPGTFWRRVPHGQFAEGLPALTQLQGMWLSVSIVPDETLYSLIAVAPAMIVLWLVAGLNQSERIIIANFLIAAVLGQALIGIAQAAGAFPFSMYDYHHPKVAIGLFASRNHFADLILVGTCLAFAVRQNWYRRNSSVISEIIFHSFLIILFLAIIGSSSRSGLLLFTILAFICYAFSLRRRLRLFFVLCTSILAFSVWMAPKFLPQTGIVKTLLVRFDNMDDTRWVIWNNSWLGAKFYFPWGSGLGTFLEAYEQNEPLFDVSPNYINAAHNEYIQLIIEYGLVGILFFMVWSLFIFINTWKNRRNPMVIHSAFGFVIILMHALFDYPFRTIGLNALICCLVAFISEPDPKLSWTPRRTV